MFFIFLSFHFRLTGILRSCSTRTASCTSQAIFPPGPAWMMLTLVIPALWAQAGCPGPGSVSPPRQHLNSRNSGSRARTTGRVGTGSEARTWRRPTESRKKISKELWSRPWWWKRNIHILLKLIIIVRIVTYDCLIKPRQIPWIPDISNLLICFESLTQVAQIQRFIEF